MRGRTGRARVAALFAAMLVSPGGIARECPPVEIRVAPSYEAPRGFVFAPMNAPGWRSGPDRELLGTIETAVGWDVEVAIRRRCVEARCELCVNRIEGEAGFEPGRMRVAVALKGDRCRTEAVVEHEMRHSRVFDESTRLGVTRLVDVLGRWARRQKALVARPEAVEAAARARYDEIGRLMEKGVAWIDERARERNERIDSPEGYAAEQDRVERRCGRNRRGPAEAQSTRPPPGRSGDRKGAGREGSESAPRP